MTPPTPAALLHATQLLARELSLPGALEDGAPEALFLRLLADLLPGRVLCLRTVDSLTYELLALRPLVPPLLEAGVEGPELLPEARSGPLHIKRAALRHTGLPEAIATSARVQLGERYLPLFSGTAHGFSVPLVAGGELGGILNCEYVSRSHPELLRRDEAALIPLCNQLAVALRAHRLRERNRRYEGYLRRMIDSVGALERLATIGQLAAEVVHELSNPLSSIGTYGDYLARRLVDRDPGDAEKARRICEGAERIQKLTRDFISYGRPTGAVEPLLLPPVVAQAVSFCEHLLRRCGVQVQIDHPADLPPIHGVRAQLQQLVVNLLTNACHALAGRPDAHVRITTRLDTLDERPAVLLTVADSGSGIPPQHQPRIFEPFFSTKADGQGTGLGLPIVKNIVESHGGHIRFETAPGEGTRFLVLLPTNRDRRERPGPGRPIRKKRALPARRE